MSGGAFDYNQKMIGYIREDIECRVNKQNQLIEDSDSIYSTYNNNTERYPILDKKIESIFKDAIECLRKAEIYAQRIDWYLSGDDGEESFISRLEEELKELDNKI